MKYLVSAGVLIISLLLISWNSAQPKGPKGKKTYDRLCSGCHGADAKGIPDFSPALSGSKIILGADNKLIRVLLKGSAELKNIPGHTNKNEMPPQANLKDRRIANLLTFIRSNFGNKAPAITPDAVKSERNKL